MAANSEYNIIAQQLEKMSLKIDSISKEIQLTNIEIAKLGGMKHTLQDLKDWKSNVEGAVNSEDLRKMKNALEEVKRHAEEIEFFEKEIGEIKISNNKDKEKIEKLESFKIQAVTIGSIIFFLLGTAITVVGWFLK